MARGWSSHGREVRDAVCRLDFDLEPADEESFGTAPATAWTRSPAPSSPRPPPGLQELARLYEARTGQSAPVARRAEPSIVDARPERPTGVERRPAPRDPRPTARPLPVAAVSWNTHPDPHELPFESEPSIWETETEMLLPPALQQTLPRIPRFVEHSGLDYDPPPLTDEPTWSIEPDEATDPQPVRWIRVEMFVLVALALLTLFVFAVVSVTVVAVALA